MEKIIKSYTHNGVSLFMFPVSNTINGVVVNNDLSSDFLNEAYSGERWFEIRNERDRLISETDWTQTSDAPLSDKKKAEFAEYRVRLRNITQDYSDPDTVVFPQKPEIQ